jgi:RNA polymerase sigma-70 factor (ECF subfamily)
MNDDQQPHPDTPPDPQLESFVHRLTESQSSLRAYLLAALGNYDDASEVLQRTNLVLWRNARKFRPEAEFMPWAVTLARFEVMSFYRDRSRDRHVFTEELALLMLQSAETEKVDLVDRQAALRHCIAQLPQNSREMVAMRYESRTSIATMATQMERTENAIKSALVRIRKALAECITKRMEIDSAT